MIEQQLAYPSSGTRLTTSNLLPQAVGQPPKWLITPPPGIGFPIPGAALPQFEATIFSTTLPPGLPTDNLQKLASYQCSDGDIITEAIGPNAPPCTFVANEGYLYVPGTPGRPPLRRWWNPSNKRSYTTAAAPSTMIPAGWQLTDVVGAVIRATINVNFRWSSIPGASYSLDVQTSTGEWIALLEAAAVPCGPINRIDEVFADPQVIARRIQIALSRPDGAVTPGVANPIRLSATPIDYDRAPPALGDGTATVLKTVLGLAEGDVEALRDSGVIG